jgi:hypothetical protein
MGREDYQRIKTLARSPKLIPESKKEERDKSTHTTKERGSIQNFELQRHGEF